MIKVSARWVPRMLLPHKKMNDLKVKASFRAFSDIIRIVIGDKI